MGPTNEVYASFFLRFLAVAVDWIIITIIVNVFTLVILFFFPLYSFISLILYLVLYLIFVAFYNVFSVYKYGGTLGKRFVGIKIIKEGGVLTLKDVLKREIIFKPLSVLLFGLGVFSMFFNLKKQTFYDKRLGIVVLVKSKLSLFKLIVAIIIGFIYFLYLFGLMRSGYTLVNFENEQNKIDLIEEIKQKRDVLIIVEKDGSKLSEFARTSINNADVKQQEFCLKQIMSILIKKSNCQLGDLNINSLKQMNKFYENEIKNLVDFQLKLENK